MSDIIFYLIVIDELTITISLILIILLFLMIFIFFLISHKNKSKQLKLLRISYMILYDVISFILPLIFVWWFALLLDIILIFIIRAFYEKQSIVMHFNEVGTESEQYKIYISKLPIVLVSAFISYISGMWLFISINLTE